MASPCLYPPAMRKERRDRKPPAPGPVTPRWRSPAIGALVAGTLALLLFLHLRSNRRAPAQKPVASAPARAPVAPPPVFRMPEPETIGSSRVGPRHKRGFEARLANYLEATRYPPESRPISVVQNLKLPEAPPQVLRTNETKGKKIEQQERQNMFYAAEGETATVVVEVAVNGKPATNVEAVSATLAKVEGSPRHSGAGIENVQFRDDGAPPDEKAHDGTVTAYVPFPKQPLEGFTGDLTLDANLKTGDTPIVATFGFLYTGHPPARFTGNVRETLEDGSLVLYMGLEVERAAAYLGRARLYDADGNAIALMTAEGGLDVGTRELRFLAFGRLLRDSQAKSPFSLRDAEAYVFLPDKYPDRLKVPTWIGPYMTRRYGPDDFSDNEWTSPEKEARVEAMRRAIEAAPE